jgi:hypothetical protein
MDIFEYLEAEHSEIELKLKEIINNYPNWSRERVFDAVKVVCDDIRGHLKKQKFLLLDNIVDDVTKIKSLLDECNKDREKIEQEIGQLVMVHVDEPGYDEYLKNLFIVIEQHVTFTQRLYKTIKQVVSSKNLDRVNAQLQEMIHHSVDFNILQPQEK